MTLRCRVLGCKPVPVLAGTQVRSLNTLPFILVARVCVRVKCKRCHRTLFDPLTQLR